MRLKELKNSTVLGVATGGAIAASWYFGLSAVLNGPIGATLAVSGAIVLGSVIPTLILNGRMTQNTMPSGLDILQRFEALNQHACINIVDNNDQLIDVNDRLLELTGYSKEELIGQPVKKLYDVPMQNLALEIRDHLRRGETWRGKTPLQRKDGSLLYTQSTIMPLFDENGRWIGSISARTDVTKTTDLVEERQATQALFELRDDIWIVDSETEQFCYMNRAAKDRLKMNDEELQSIRLDELDPDYNVEDVLEACRALRSSGETSTQFKTLFLGVPSDVSVKFLTGNEGDSQYLILFNDISERIEQEERKSAFISTVSHELRSPLTSIKGAMGLLLSGSAGELPEKARGLLEIAHRNSDRLVLIINDILDLDKISNGQMEFDTQDVDLAELVSEADQANAMLQQRFGVEVALVGMTSPVPFRTDPNRFIQVLTNLLSNAYKFSKPNSCIQIELQDEADHVRVSVRDEGPGIPLDEQHKIFARFADMANSDRSAKGGTGLGLSICKAIVENLGGEIGFDSDPGVGTTFYFSFPKTPRNSSNVAVMSDKLSA